MIRIRQVIRSFRHAFRGLAVVFRSEQNFRIQVGVAFFVFIAMFVLDTSRAEKVALVLVASSVLVLELLNSV
ncbi:MAG: diacylglycerol kinase family protein, partial [bacterium]|nr:diacylglycerol kinase family protein [bacterium]